MKFGISESSSILCTVDLCYEIESMFMVKDIYEKSLAPHSLEKR